MGRSNSLLSYQVIRLLVHLLNHKNKGTKSVFMKFTDVQSYRDVQKHLNFYE